MKPKNSLAKDELHIRASRFLGLRPEAILNVVPNSSRRKYFIHYVCFTRKNKALYITELVDAKEFGGSKSCR